MFVGAIGDGVAIAGGGGGDVSRHDVAKLHTSTPLLNMRVVWHAQACEQRLLAQGDPESVFFLSYFPSSVSTM